jgi:hypothetical protein
MNVGIGLTLEGARMGIVISSTFGVLCPKLLPKETA